MSVFTIGFFDFRVNISRGVLDIGFVDYEELVDISYKFNASYALDLFISEFETEVNQLKYSLISNDIQNQLLGVHERVFREVLISTGNILITVMQEFYRYAQYRNFYDYRNVVGGMFH